jgi:Flp pilus assembly protein TadD
VTNLPTGLDNGRSEERTAMLLWLVDNGRGDEALRRLPAVEADHPEPARLLLRIGQALDEQRGAALAIPLLERSRTLDPTRAQTRLALGRALYDAGRPNDAVPHLRAGVEADPGARAGRWLLVQALATTGQAGEAAAWLERICEAPPTDASNLLALGDMAVDLRRPDLAVRVLDQVIAMGRPGAVVREKRGLALVMLGRSAEARADLLEAHRLDPQSASICLNLAVAEAQGGSLDAARTLAREALRLQPVYPQARGLLAILDRVR